jgi:hypothetical protein
MRHNVIINKLRLFANRVGCTALAEPQSHDDQQRGDLHVITPDGDHIWTDATIVQPTAPTWLKRGTAKTQLAAANIRTLEKHTQYDHVAAQHQADFYAFAVEVFGSLTDEAKAFAKRIAKYAARSSCPWTAKEVYSDLISSIAVGLQTGNVRIFERMRLMNKAHGLVIPDLVRATTPDTERDTSPLRVRITARVPAPTDGFGDVDEKMSLMPEQPPTPRVFTFEGLSFLDVDPNDITDVEPEDEDAGFADIAGIAAEMHELDDLLEDDELCFDDGHFEQTTAVARQFI